MRSLLVDEVAERLKKSPSTIRRLLLMGRLRGIKVDGVWKIKESDLEAFVMRQPEYRIRRGTIGRHLPKTSRRTRRPR